MSGSIKTHLFGMPAEKGRWLFVVLGFLVYICLGTIYSYSVFKGPVQELFAISSTESNLPFMLVVATSAFMSFMGGNFLLKCSPKKLGVIGAVLMGGGWILSGLLPRFIPNIWILTLTYSFIAGSGLGLTYGIPIAVVNKWFPDKRGLAVGLTLAGFGGSPIITANIATPLISAVGPLQTFLLFGIVFLIILLILSQLYKFPADEWKPYTGKSAVKNIATSTDFTRGQMIKTRSFLGLFLAYTIGSLAGLMAIGIASPVGTEMVNLDVITAGSMVGIFAIFNAAGRPLFGWLTDRITPRWTIFSALIISSLASLLMWMPGQKSLGIYIVSFSLLWLCYGGWLAIAPSATTMFFGIKNYTANYGVMFLGNGTGSLLGNLISGQSKDLFGSYSYAFLAACVLSVVAIIISLILLKPPAARIKQSGVTDDTSNE